MSINWTGLEERAESWVENEYESVLKPLIVKDANSLKPLLAATEDDIEKYGIPIVVSFVGSVLTGKAKMSAAIPLLISALGAVGKYIVASDAQAGLQILVNTMRKPDEPSTNVAAN